MLLFRVARAALSRDLALGSGHASGDVEVTMTKAEGQGEGSTRAVPRVAPAGMKPHRSPSAANSSDRSPPQASGPKEGGNLGANLRN